MHSYFLIPLLIIIIMGGNVCTLIHLQLVKRSEKRAEAQKNLAEAQEKGKNNCNISD